MRASISRLAVLLASLSLLGCEPVRPPLSRPATTVGTVAKPAEEPPRLPPARIVTLAEAEQRAHWRKLAASEAAAPAHRAEALRQLALLGDDATAALAARALDAVDRSARLTAIRVLAYLGEDAAAASGRALRAALAESRGEDRSEILWALVAQGDGAIAEEVIEAYLGGRLGAVERLEGGPAFDPRPLAALLAKGGLGARADDPRPAVRALVALVLSYSSAPDASDTLARLAADADRAVARQAAVGLGRLGTEQARTALLQTLRRVASDDYAPLLAALRDGAGAPALVIALDAIDPRPEERAWFQTKQLFDLIRDLADPRGGDALVGWLERAGAHPHWRGQAAIALAETGDLRAAPYLGQRLQHDRSLYDQEKSWQANEGGHLSRTDQERVVSARMLVALAAIHPDRHAELLGAAEAPVLAWLRRAPRPHFNGLYFLAAAGSQAVLDPLRKWAFPADPLPPEGAQPPFPAAFETAQSALRCLGRMRDPVSLDRILGELDRNDAPRLDITQEALMESGRAMRGMALRAVALGAANGLSEWAPVAEPRVAERLLAFIEDRMWHEEARMAACEALPFVASEAQLRQVATERLPRLARADAGPADRFLVDCYVVALSRRPRPGLVDELVGLLRPELPDVARSLAVALGRSGVPPGSSAEAKLGALAGAGALRVPATLALVLGGSRDVAARAAVALGGHGPSLGALKDAYYRALDFWSEEDLGSGAVQRWVANARAIARAGLDPTTRRWAEDRLASLFEMLAYDNGPHSLTRPVLRWRLWQQARNGDGAPQQDAVAALGLARERGSLMALCEARVAGACRELGRLRARPTGPALGE